MYEIGGMIPLLQAWRLRLRGLVHLPMSKSEALADPVPTLKSAVKHSFNSKA